jgi:hypothetical protein
MAIRFSYKNPVCTHSSLMCATCRADLILDHSNNISQGVQVMKLLIMQWVPLLNTNSGHMVVISVKCRNLCTFICKNQDYLWMQRYLISVISYMTQLEKEVTAIWTSAFKILMNVKYKCFICISSAGRCVGVWFKVCTTDIQCTYSVFTKDWSCHLEQDSSDTGTGGPEYLFRNRECYDKKLGCFVHFFMPTITGPLTLAPPSPTIEPSARNTKVAWG